MHERIQDDLTYINDMAAEMKDYLLSDDLYWHTSGTVDTVTLGGMLVRLRRLYAVHNQLEGDNHQTYHDAKSALENQLDKWQVQAENKAKREIKTRLDEWGRVVDEFEGDLQAYISNWPTAAYSRTALQLLIELDEDLLRENQAELLAALDARMRLIIKPDDFMWGEPFADGFPQDRYWWLYAQPDEHKA